MRKLSASLLALALSLGASLSMLAGGPQRAYNAQYRQADGTTLTLSEQGNGRYVVSVTTDGYAVLRADGGRMVYAIADSALGLRPSAILAHDPAQRSAGESAFLAQSGITRLDAAARLERLLPAPRYQQLQPTARSVASTADGLGKYGRSGAGVIKSIGSPRIPVILAGFSDVAFQDTIDATKISRYLNEKGYSDERLAKGSVKDYFLSQSNGRFAPEFDVVATVSVSGTRASYGADGSNGSIDLKGSQYVKDAISEACKTVDFTPYADSNGKVPMVAVIYPGPGQQSSFETGKSDYLWAKFSTGYSISTGEGRPTVTGFLMTNELLQSYGTGPNDIRGAEMEGIGLFAHEFGHALGLNDFYYTGSDADIAASLLTMDYWDIMDYGQYYMNGYAPPGYTAYERSSLGWLNVKELTEPAFCSLYPFGREAEGATAYVVRNPKNEQEYFLLENRQPDGQWYPKAMGSGMLITHVDYDAGLWAGNRVNNDPARQRMAYIPADGKRDGTKTSADLSLAQLFNGYKGDLFPGTTATQTFAAPTAVWQTPGSNDYAQGLYNIALSSDGVITFSFINPELTAITSPLRPAETPATVYDLQGRRVSSLDTAPRGIYIVGGKKVIKQ